MPNLTLELPLRDLELPVEAQSAVCFSQFKAARWLQMSKSPTHQGSWFIVRGRIELAHAPTQARALAAADSKYWLYINGKLAVAEGGLKRGPAPGQGYFDTFELPDFLVQGSNSIAALVWYFGRSGFSHSDSGAPGFLFELQDACGNWLGGTGEGWEYMEHPAYFDAGFLRDGYRLSESGIGYDARRAPGSWMDSNFTHASLRPAPLGERAHCEPWGKLQPRPIPFFYWKEKTPLQNLSEVQLCGGLKLVKGKLPANIQFVPYFRLSAPEGVKVQVWSGLETSPMTLDYITSEGEQSFESPAWMSGEEICLLTDCNHQIQEFGYRETGYSASPAGGFHCNDPFLNSLWHKSLRTLHVTMRDTFMDCPCRERAQWPGDFVIQLGQVPYCLELSALDLVGKAFQEFASWQKSDGILFGPLPGNWDKELPAQMLALVSPFGFWTYYLFTGHEEELASFYAATKRYMSVWRIADDGLVEYREGDWDWLDWGEFQDPAPMLNAWFILALEGCASMAQALGFASDATGWNQKRLRCIEGFRSKYWRPGLGFASADRGNPVDERVQALAVLAEIATESHQPEILKSLIETCHCSPYMEKYVLEALLKIGKSRAALQRMRKRYAGMISGSQSTLHEIWPELKSPGSSQNHSWSGGPLTLLSSRIAGLRPAAPGWKMICFEPQLGDLTDFSAQVETPMGEVKVSFQESSSPKVRLQTCAPASVELRGAHAKAPIRATDSSGITRVFETTFFDLPPGLWELDF